MSEHQQTLAIYDDRPFFETALRHGVRNAIITAQKSEAINAGAPKGLVQIASLWHKVLAPGLRPRVSSIWRASTCSKLASLERRPLMWRQS